MVTGSDLVESKNAVKIAEEHRKYSHTEALLERHHGEI